MLRTVVFMVLAGVSARGVCRRDCAFRAERSLDVDAKA